jgi:hypothetical protein
MLRSTVPSEWARNLVRGAYDLHVHVAPDVMRRRVTDVQLARRCWDAGLAGFVLKSHYVPTAERAAVVNEALGGEVQVLGALALNASVGGMNPLAVEIAAREGARILWMPTVDAANHRAFGRDFAPDAQPPPWLALQQDLDSQGITVDPVAVVDDAGVRHVIATHPDFPQQDMGLDDQLALAQQGVFLERCFCPPYTGMCDWARMVANIRATGPAAAIVTTDLGQPDNPPVEDGLALMADALQAQGFTDEEITTMIVDNSRLLAGADALRADPRRM